VLLGLLLVLVSISAIYLRSVIQSTQIQLEQAHRRPPPRSNRAAEDPVTLQRRERSNLEQTHHQLQHQLQIQEQEYQTLQGDHQLLRDRLNGLETTRGHVIEAVEVERNQWNHLEEEDKHTIEAFQEEEGTNKREEALWARVDRLTRSIGNESERDALEW
jgi:chromosome segregation ATPase